MIDMIDIDVDVVRETFESMERKDKRNTIFCLLRTKRRRS